MPAGSRGRVGAGCQLCPAVLRRAHPVPAAAPEPEQEPRLQEPRPRPRPAETRSRGPAPCSRWPGGQTWVPGRGRPGLSSAHTGPCRETLSRGCGDPTSHSATSPRPLRSCAAYLGRRGQGEDQVAGLWQTAERARRRPPDPASFSRSLSLRLSVGPGLAGDCHGSSSPSPPLPAAVPPPPRLPYFCRRDPST